MIYVYSKLMSGMCLKNPIKCGRNASHIMPTFNSRYLWREPKRLSNGQVRILAYYWPPSGQLTTEV